MSLTVRIEEPAHQKLKSLAAREGITLQTALTKAIEVYERHTFLEGLAHDFAALREDSGAWSEELAERDAWDASLRDGGEG